MSALDRYYSPNDTENYDKDLNDVVDLIQESLECCGINNTEDWMSSPYFEESMRVPSSCCDKDEPEVCEEDEVYTKVRDLRQLLNYKRKQILVHVTFTGLPRSTD